MDRGTGSGHLEPLLPSLLRRRCLGWAMGDGAAELELFRRRWRAELAEQGRPRRRGRKRPREAEGGAREEAVRGWGGCGALARWEPEGEAELLGARRSLAGPDPQRKPAPLAEAPAGGGGGKEDLLGQLIQDLNEINEVPFFDIQLPYELALKIFQFLGRTELGRCAQ
ncbi:F-box/WD repeat-containing protein 8-like, partial [Sceloporus undulatus]|uniref:F-box/WD repeat-containing protein 8-like n=1 Tax=Sceloporus undulatus TaxID=8520 RepID=UPI001C4C0049